MLDRQERGIESFDMPDLKFEVVFAGQGDQPSAWATSMVIGFSTKT